MHKLAVPSLMLLSVVSFGVHATNNALSLKYEHVFHPDNDSRRAVSHANDYELKMEYAHKFRGDTYDWTDGLTLGFENYFQKTNGKQNVNFTLKSSYNIKSDMWDGFEYGPILEYQWRVRGRSPNTEIQEYDDLESYERLKAGFAVAYRFDSEWRIRLRYRYMYTFDHKVRDDSAAMPVWQEYAQDGISAETNFYVYYTPEYYDRDAKFYLKSTVYNKIERESVSPNGDDSYYETGKSWKPAFELGVEYNLSDYGSVMLAYKARPYDNSLEDPVGNKDGIEIGYRMRW